MIGKKFGMLMVEDVLPKSKVLCRCECGATRVMRIGHFNAGYASSCGCHWRNPSGINREKATFWNMMARCHNPKNKRYKDYGAVGITVCDEWRGNPKKFYEDMGLCPDGYQIDRIDNTKGYSKENCRWVSPKENMANRSVSIEYIINGERYKSANDASLAKKVSKNTISAWCKGRLAKGVFYPPKPNCSFEHVYKARNVD